MVQEGLEPEPQPARVKVTAGVATAQVSLFKWHLQQPYVSRPRVLYKDSYKKKKKKKEANFPVRWRLLVSACSPVHYVLLADEGMPVIVRRRWRGVSAPRRLLPRAVRALLAASRCRAKRPKAVEETESHTSVVRMPVLCLSPPPRVRGWELTRSGMRVRRWITNASAKISIGRLSGSRHPGGGGEGNSVSRSSWSPSSLLASESGTASASERSPSGAPSSGS